MTVAAQRAHFSARLRRASSPSPATPTRRSAYSPRVRSRPFLSCSISASRCRSSGTSRENFCTYFVRRADCCSCSRVQRLVDLRLRRRASAIERPLVVVPRLGRRAAEQAFKRARHALKRLARGLGDSAGCARRRPRHAADDANRLPAWSLPRARRLRAGAPARGSDRFGLAVTRILHRPALRDARQASSCRHARAARARPSLFAPSMRRARLCVPPFGSITTKSRRSPRARSQPDFASAVSNALPFSAPRQSAVRCFARRLRRDLRPFGLLHLGVARRALRPRLAVTLDVRALHPLVPERPLKFARHDLVLAVIVIRADRRIVSAFTRSQTT